jgi:hypothetical protein
MAIHRGNHWTPEEDQRLLELIGSGKSWMLISALLKRNQLSIKERARYLKVKPSSHSGVAKGFRRAPGSRSRA